MYTFTHKNTKKIIFLKHNNVFSILIRDVVITSFSLVTLKQTNISPSIFIMNHFST